MRATLLVIAALATAAPLIAQERQVTSDGVPLHVVHVDDDGHGILRFSDPEGREIDFVAATGGLVPDSDRPFEAFSTLGTWTGPDLSLCLQYLTPERVEEMNLGVQVYAPAEQAAVARYRIVFDTDEAEEIVSTEGGTGPGECHANFLR